MDCRVICKFVLIYFEVRTCKILDNLTFLLNYSNLPRDPFFSGHGVDTQVNTKSN